MTQDVIYRFIDSQQFGVFGTLGAADRKPQSALVGIAVTPNLEIVFDTVRASRKYQNLIQNPSASFVIGCAGEITVQFEGEARELSGTELAVYQEIYFVKWPDGRERLGWPGITYVAVKPHWIRYSDFTASRRSCEELVFSFQ